MRRLMDVYVILSVSIYYVFVEC